MDAVIFDVDGTLCNVTAVRHHVLSRPRNFHAFHADSIDCPPHQEVVEATHLAHAAGYEVIVVTARENRWSFHTALWLHENNVYYDRLLMRSANDFRPDRTIKAEILNALLLSGYRIVEAWDDNPSIISLWEDNNIPVHLVPGWLEDHQS